VLVIARRLVQNGRTGKGKVGEKEKRKERKKKGREEKEKENNDEWMRERGYVEAA